MRDSRPDGSTNSRTNVSAFAGANTVAFAANVDTDACANAVADGVTDTAAHSCPIAVADITNLNPDAAPYFAPVIAVTCPTNTTANTSTAALSTNVARELA